jgi:hypothetical protein
VTVAVAIALEIGARGEVFALIDHGYPSRDGGPDRRPRASYAQAAVAAERPVLPTPVAAPIIVIPPPLLPWSVQHQLAQSLEDGRARVHALFLATGW